MRWAALLLLAACCSAALAGPVPELALQYRRTLTRSAQAAFGLLAPVPAMAAQIHQESRWRPTARSYAGAAGLAQFMPGTARWIAAEYPQLGPVDVFSPIWSIRAMVRYDRHLWPLFPESYDDCEQMAYVLGAYNGGSGWMRKRISMSAYKPWCLGVTCNINPGIAAANQKQNQEYSQRILLRWQALYATWGRTLCGESWRQNR